MDEYSVVQDFIRRLRGAEERGDATQLAELFTTDAKLEMLTRPTHGKRAMKCTAVQFWNQYLHAFDYVASHFTNVIETEGVAILEWSSTGRLPMGTPIEYSGVTIFEHDEKRITALRTYYDSAALLANSKAAVKPYSETVGLPDINTEASS